VATNGILPHAVPEHEEVKISQLDFCKAAENDRTNGLKKVN